MLHAALLARWMTIRLLDETAHSALLLLFLSTGFLSFNLIEFILKCIHEHINILNKWTKFESFLYVIGS